MAAATFEQKKYKKEHITRLYCDCLNEVGSVYKAYAKEKGVSISKLIKEALDEKMLREGATPPVKPRYGVSTGFVRKEDLRNEKEKCN